VLAILAARLGWAPVRALDVDPTSIAAANGNADRNGVLLEFAVADLASDMPPGTDGFAANVPAAVHRSIAAGWRERAPRTGLLSGFGPDEADEVIGAYESIGLRERHRDSVSGWVVVVLQRD
jgi:ribosomal protein L11 methyltransferase